MLLRALVLKLWLSLQSLSLSPSLPPSLSLSPSGLWSVLSVGLLVVTDQAQCNLHATFEGLCYCELRMPVLVSLCRVLGNVFNTFLVTVLYLYLVLLYLPELWGEVVVSTSRGCHDGRDHHVHQHCCLRDALPPSDPTICQALFTVRKKLASIALFREMKH